MAAALFNQMKNEKNPQVPPATPERKHHVNSASSLAAKEVCPCFVGRSGDNEASIAGTKCHEAVESGDLTGLTDDQAMAVEKVIAYRDTQVAKFQARFKSPVKKLQEFEVRIDEKPQPEGDIGTSGGFLDFAVLSPDRDEAILMDWKFVQWEVEPVENNVQFQVYSLGLRNAYPSLKRVEVHCVCPYLGFIDVHTFEGKDFEKHYMRVCAIVARKADPQAEPKPAFPNCTFCANLGRCKAVAELVIHVSQKHNPVRVPAEINPMLMGNLDEQGRRDAMILATVCSAWSESVRQIVNDLALADGKEVEGFTLVKSSPRTVVDKDGFRRVALNFIPAERWGECYDVFISKVEEIIKKTSERGFGAARIREFAAALEERNLVEPGPERAFLRQKRQALDA